jgi:hypothetical protein
MLGNNQPLLKRVKGIEEPISIDIKGELAQTRVEFGSAFVVQPSNLQWHPITQMLTEWVNSPAFAYSGLAYIADSPITAMADVPKPNRQECLSFIRPEGQSKPLLQAITNLKLQAAMDSMSDPSGGALTRSSRIIGAIETTLSEITGSKFRFQVTSYPNVSIGVYWGHRTLPFDLLPDGLRSIIGWLVHAVVMMDTWLQGKSDPMKTEAVFLLDEIESHLHPAWQRKILPAFQRLFPQSQIFIATHSPFVIASLPWKPTAASPFRNPRRPARGTATFRWLKTSWA